jgi:hypothetical protein
MKDFHLMEHDYVIKDCLFKKPDNFLYKIFIRKNEMLKWMLLIKKLFKKELFF